MRAKRLGLSLAPFLENFRAAWSSWRGPFDPTVQGLLCASYVMLRASAIQATSPSEPLVAQLRYGRELMSRARLIQVREVSGVRLMARPSRVPVEAAQHE